MTEKQMNEKALADLSSPIVPDRAQACEYMASAFLNGGFRWVSKYAALFLPRLLSLVPTDPLAGKPLASAAQVCWGAMLYAEALECLDAITGFSSAEVLSNGNRPWDDWKIPYTREQEIAVNRLWRFECLLALGRTDEAKKDEDEIIARPNACLPQPFKLTSGIYEWGDAHDFCIKARLNAANAQRLFAMGLDPGWRKAAKKPKPPQDAADKIALARRFIDEALPHLEKSLVEFAGLYPGEPVKIQNIDESRRVGTWRAEGYAVAGFLAKDAGDIEKAKIFFADAHWLYLLAGRKLEGELGDTRETFETLLEFAPQPDLFMTSGEPISR